MTDLNDTTQATQSNPVFVFPISATGRFWLFLIPDVLSILCSLFVLYHLLSDRVLRHALNNHIIIILLFVGLIYESTTIPFSLHYYRFGYAWSYTIAFSRFWQFIYYFSYTTQLIGFAWASIERHILIFHSQWVATRKKRLFVHYLPIIAIFVYCFTYYVVFMLFPFCGDLHYPSPTDGVPVACLFSNLILGKWETICHLIIPTFIVVVFSLALLIRVLWQKSRLNRSIDWRRQRKMTIQLLSISILYLLLGFPRSLLQLCAMFGLSSETLLNCLLLLGFFAIYIILLFPFVCCASMSELGKKFKKIFCCWHEERAIGPVTLTMNRMDTKRIVPIKTNN